MNEEIQNKMQDLMYSLTKNAARESYLDFLEYLDITWDEYEMIKEVWKEKLGVEPTYNAKGKRRRCLPSA